jgi:hypothetical protein
MSNKCIYCKNGTDDEITVSHIIPDALTNTKIKCSNVCKQKHNSKFSDEFESKVIEEFAFITNELRIKSDKAKSFAKYSALIEVDGVEYPVAITDNFNLFNRVLKYDKVVIDRLQSRLPRLITFFNIDVTNAEKCYSIFKLNNNNQEPIIAPKETAKKIASSKGMIEDEIERIDISEKSIKGKVVFNLDTIYSIEIMRLIAKIAYEWFCYKNNINEYNSCFEKIIDFIVSGTVTDDMPIKIFTNGKITENINIICNEGQGSHFLFSSGELDRISVMVSLFGLCTYVVDLGAFEINDFDYVYMYEILRVDGTKEFCCKYVDLVDLLLDSSSTTQAINTGSCFEINNKFKLMDMAIAFRDYQTEIKCFSNPSNMQSVIYSFKNNWDLLLNSQTVNIRMLKTFVSNIDNTFSLELCFNNSKKTLLLYFVWLIGKSELESMDNKKLKYIEKMHLFTKNGELDCTPEWVESIKEMLLSDEKTSEYISLGKEKILKTSKN